MKNKKERNRKVDNQGIRELEGEEKDGEFQTEKRRTEWKINV